MGSHIFGIWGVIIFWQYSGNFEYSKYRVIDLHKYESKVRVLNSV